MCRLKKCLSSSFSRESIRSPVSMKKTGTLPRAAVLMKQSGTKAGSYSGQL